MWQALENGIRQRPGLVPERMGLFFIAGFALSWLYIHFGVTAESTPDFTIFYAAGTPGPVYDAQWITSLQHLNLGLRPFAYPPTSLVFLRPLALLSYETAFALWSAISLTLFTEAAVRLAPRLWVLALVSPVVIIAFRFGQTPLLIGGLVALGFSLTSRPLLAGMLFGVAFSLKPQVMLLLPVAIALRGEWRTLIAMLTTGALVCIASLALGPHLWLQWMQSLQAFRSINDSIGVARLDVPWPFTPIAVVAAIALVAATRTADPRIRHVATIGGSLLISPHACAYEAAMLVPAAVGLMSPISWRSAPNLVVLLFRVLPWWVLALWTLASPLLHGDRVEESKVDSPAGGAITALASEATSTR